MMRLFCTLEGIGLERARRASLGVLLCCLANSSLLGQTSQAPYDVQKLRANHRLEEARVEEFFRKQIPKEAYLPDGSVDISNPEWQKINKQAARTQRRLGERYNALERRPEIYDQAVRETGAQLHNTGSDPKAIHADMDFTPETYADGQKLTEHLRKKGFTIDTSNPARWEIPELDAVIWKPYPNEPTGSSAKDAFVAQKARPGSDAYAPGGAMEKVSPYGVKGEHGAALGNVKKGLDARADLAAGRSDSTINLKEQAKAAWKATEWTGTPMEPELKAIAENLKGYKGPADAGVYNRGDSPEIQAEKIQHLEERIDGAYKDALKEGARKGARRARIAAAVVKHLLFPQHGSGLAIQGDDMSVERGHEEAVPENSQAAVHQVATGDDLRRKLALVVPNLRPCRGVQCVNLVWRDGQVHDVVHDERRRFELVLERFLKDPLETKIGGVGGADFLQGAVAMSLIVAVVGEPLRAGFYRH